METLASTSPESLWSVEVLDWPMPSSINQAILLKNLVFSYKPDDLKVKPTFLLQECGGHGGCAMGLWALCHATAHTSCHTGHWPPRLSHLPPAPFRHVS